MEILELPFTWLIGIVFGLGALYVFLRGLRLPPNFTEKQKERVELKRKIDAIKQASEPVSIKEKS